MNAVRRELAKPRVARSARMEEQRLDPTLIAEPPSTTITGSVQKIIPARIRGNPGKAVIVLDEAERPYRTIRIDDTLIDEHGGDVRLKKGAHVDVTVTTKHVNRRPLRRN